MVDDTGRRTRGDLTAEQKVSLWHISHPNEFENPDQIRNDAGSLPHGELQDDDDLEQSPNDGGPSFQENLGGLDEGRIHFVVNTASYSWLMAALRSRSQLDTSESHALQTVRSFVSSALHNYRGSRALWTQSAAVQMSWDPKAFIKQQGYESGRSLPSRHDNQWLFGEATIAIVPPVRQTDMALGGRIAPRGADSRHLGKPGNYSKE